jgi:hypothetical protein
VQEAVFATKQTLVNQGILNAVVLQKKIQPHEAHAAEKRDWKSWSAAYLFTKQAP